MTSGREAHVKKSIKYFDEAIRIGGNKQLLYLFFFLVLYGKILGNSPAAIDALFGKAQYLVSENEPKKARELFNEVLGFYEKFTPAIIESAKVMISLPG